MNADSSFTRKWEIEARGTFTEINIGPQIGSGEMGGMVKNGIFSISLNPDRDDDQIYLWGEWSKKENGGEWIWSTFSGPTASGSFELKRK